MFKVQACDNQQSTDKQLASGGQVHNTRGIPPSKVNISNCRLHRHWFSPPQQTLTWAQYKRFLDQRRYKRGSISVDLLIATKLICITLICVIIAESASLESRTWPKQIIEC